MFNFLLPFLAKKEHLCVPDCSSSRGTSLHGVYALSTLVHAPQSWPLSRKQITPVLAIVNFFFAHRRCIKLLCSPLYRARFLGKSGNGTINNKERKTSRTEEDRSSIDRSGAVIFWLHCFARALGSKRVTTNSNDRNFIPGQCNPWSRFHAPDEARRFSRGGREFARFQVNIRPDNLSLSLSITVFCKLRSLARCALLHPFNYTRINAANSFRLHRSYYSNLFDSRQSSRFAFVAS